MANNRKGSGKTYTVASASGSGILSGVPTVQENFFGIPLSSPASGESFELAIEGRWRIAVPASTVRGDFLYVPSSAGGVLLTEAVAPTLTRTSSNANAPVCKAMEDRDSTTGLADVLILPPGAVRAATQV